MNRWRLSRQSFRYYRKTQLTVVLGLTIASAVLTGALVVGDSVKFSLKKLALARIGQCDSVVSGNDHFFRSALADELQKDDVETVAPCLMLQGSVAHGGGSGRVNDVQLVGYDERFWKLSPSGTGPEDVTQVYLNRPLAERMNVKPGEMILLRMAKPSAIPRDAPLSDDENFSATLRIKLGGIIDEEQFGSFGLAANQRAPYSAFIPLPLLQERVELPGRANLLLLSHKSHISVDTINTKLNSLWKLEDAECRLKLIKATNEIELRSSRIFMDRALEKSVLEIPRAVPVFTYFVNELRNGSRAVPYSMLTAMPLEGLAKNEMHINQWLAQDLNLSPGDKISTRYFVMGEKRSLEEVERAFTVSKILPMEGRAVDSTLMPDYPGLSESENCRDWDPSFPLDTDRIRDRDEAYWDLYRGAPKGFIQLAEGQQMWGNRFGQVTAIRWPAEDYTLAQLKHELSKKLKPAQSGVQIIPIREQALKASGEGLALGEYFLAFSFFLVGAALLLSGMLFVFGLEQRRSEIGSLLAFGFTPKQVLSIFLREGLFVAVLGGFFGALLGPLYTYALLEGLNSIWRQAVGQATLSFHVTWSSVLIGGLSGALIGGLTIYGVMRKQTRRPIQEMLSGESTVEGISVSTGKFRWRFLLAIPLALTAIGIVALAIRSPGDQSHMAFYTAGSLFLLVGMLLVWEGLHFPFSIKKPIQSLTGLAFRGLSRRRGRSLATVALLACGTFMVVSTAAFRQRVGTDVANPKSGTGGFTLVASFTQPVLRDLNSSEDREHYGLDPELFDDSVRVHSIRVRGGDEASCLNLNRAQKPRLLGIEAQAFQGRFTTAQSLPAFDDWQNFKERHDGAIPAAVDLNSMKYALGNLKIGDRITYLDASGKPFDVVLVLALANSMLQGNLLIDESFFIESYPSASGFNQAYIEVPADKQAEVQTAMTDAFEDYGIDIESAAERLQAFNQVANTYLSIFQVLGGLGILLGSFGLGVVVLRNMLERRSELALLRAVGFRASTLKRTVLHEHLALLVLGLLIGAVSGILAVLPGLLTAGSELSILSLLVLLGAIFLNGLLWTWFAASRVMRGNLINSLRND